MDKVENYVPCDANKLLWKSIEKDNLEDFIYKAKYYSDCFDYETDQMVELYDAYIYCLTFDKTKIAKYLDGFVHDQYYIHPKRHYTLRKFICPLYKMKLKNELIKEKELKIEAKKIIMFFLMILQT